MPKKPTAKKAPKSRKPSVKPKREPEPDFNQIAFRTVQETIRRSELMRDK